MSEDNYKTNFPKHMQFSEYDWTEGERMLAISPIFREEELTLYCGVPFHDLRRYGPVPKTGSQFGVLDYVVCKGKDVILSAEVSDRDSWRELPARVADIPCVSITAREMAVGDCRKILRKLRELVDKGRMAPWHTCYGTEPQKLFPQFLRCQMIEKVDGGWEPTEFGTASGLVKEITHKGRVTVRYSHVTEALFNLTVERHETPPEKPFRMSLKERIHSVRSGVRCNPENSTQLVEELVNMPLTTLIDEHFQKQQEQLRIGLPMNCKTYGEAAQAIHSMLYSGDKKAFDAGIGLMKALAIPAALYAIAHLPQRYNAQDRPEIVAYLTQKSESHLQLGSAPKLASLLERSARLEQQACPAERLGMFPLKRFFQGVSTLCHMDYPQWVGEQILRFWNLPVDHAYGEMLHDAACWTAETPDNSEEDRKTGAFILYLLLIEPVYLIDQQNHLDIYEKELNCDE